MQIERTEIRASLEDSLTMLGEALAELKTAKPVDTGEVIAQLKLAEESALAVRTLMSSELDALIAEIQKSLGLKTEQLRSRLLALATELERGTIVHRRTPRVEELNQLRRQAIRELRSQARMEAPVPYLPGPGAQQWIAWASALKEPEDADSLGILRSSFGHVDNFVGNLEPGMWVPAASPALLVHPQTERSVHTTRARQQTKTEEPAVSASLIRLITNLGRQVNRGVEPQVSSRGPRAISAAPTINFELKTASETLFAGKWPVVMAAVAVLAVAVLGLMQWKSQINLSRPLQTIKRTVADFARLIPNASEQPAVSDGSVASASSPSHRAERQDNRNDHRTASARLVMDGPTRAERISDAALRSPARSANSAGTAQLEADSESGDLFAETQNHLVDILKQLGFLPVRNASHDITVPAGLAESLLVHQVKPRYPSDALRSRVQGTVIVRADIEKDGTVRNVFALRGPPLLLGAAVDAVKQWRYKPYYLNGKPVQASTRVSVNFTL